MPLRSQKVEKASFDLRFVGILTNILGMPTTTTDRENTIELQRLKKRIKTLAGEKGAALVGIASLERLLTSPPSGDPRYLLPSAQAAVAMAIPFDKRALREFFRKTDWRSYNLDKKTNTQLLYMIGDALRDVLRREGFEALVVDINNNYRPEPGAKDVSEMVSMIPDFSHRYGAVAAGIGRLGWSGNLMTPGHGSAVLLGTVLTSARLPADPLLNENPCDRCKMCVASCPVDMIGGKDRVTVTVAGIQESIAQKRTNTCCWIGCTGYHGLSPDRRWSSWSPYRLDTPLPALDTDVDELCTKLRKADPDANLNDLNIYTNYRESFFDPGSLFFSVCGNCANICWPARKDRIANRKMLAASGTVILRTNGERSAVRDESAVIEIETNLHARAAMSRREYEAARRGEIDIRADNAHSLFDKRVLHSI